MSKRTKPLIMLGIPIMLLFWGSMPLSSSNYFKSPFAFVKNVEGKKVFAGEKLKVTLSLKNTSWYDFIRVDIRKELRQKDFLVPGKNVIRIFKFKHGEKRIIHYTVVPIKPGKLKLGGSRVLTGYVPPGTGHDYLDGCNSNPVELEVIPFDLKLSFELDKIKALQGTDFPVTVLVENCCPVPLEGVALYFEKEEENKDRIIIQRMEKSIAIPPGKSRKVKLQCKALSNGDINIGRIFLKRFKALGAWRTLQKGVCSAESMTVRVLPLNITISQSFDKRRIRVGEKLPFDVSVLNQSPFEIENVEILFEDNSKKIQLVPPKTKSRVIAVPTGRETRICYEYRAIMAGKVFPGKAILKKIKFKNLWHNCDKVYYSSHAGPEIELVPGKLPGIKFPLEHLDRKLKTYFDHFILKALGIALFLLILFSLFKLLISTNIVEFLFGKMFLNFFAAAVLSQVLLLFFTGCLWFWRSITPTPWEFAALLTGSFCLSFAFALFPTKNLLLGSTLSGTVLAFVTYLIFIGYQAYVIQGFSNFPLPLSLVLFFMLGLGINLHIFRKI